MIELYYWPTPNGKKVTILLEECGLDYKITPVSISRGDQFASDFLKLNPNHRMPVMVDHKPADGGAPISAVSYTHLTLPTARPRCTAGRLPISSNHRLKYLNSPMSCPWACQLTVHG